MLTRAQFIAAQRSLYDIERRKIDNDTMFAPVIDGSVIGYAPTNNDADVMAYHELNRRMYARIARARRRGTRGALARKGKRNAR